MQHYILSKALQQIYKIDVYITRRMFQTLKLYFQLDNHLPIAEESLCGFEKFFKVYMSEYRRKMFSLVKEETSRRKTSRENILETKENIKTTDLVSVLHSSALYTAKYDVTDDMRYLCLTRTL